MSEDRKVVSGQEPIPTGDEKKNRKKRLIIIFILVFLAIVLASVAFFCSKPIDSWFDSNATEGSYVGKSEEEILADLNRIVEEGMMNISIAATVTFEDGTSEGEARIENIAANTRDQKVTITLNDTGEVVFESGAIAPGSYLQYIKLNKDLEAGTYMATATFQGYDPETHEERGAAAAEIRLVVLN